MIEVINKINLFKIDELSKESFNKAKNDYEYGEIELNNEFFQKEIKDDIFEKYDLDAKFQYSLSYCQGDGLSFDCDNFLTTKVINIIKKSLTKKEIYILNFLVKYGYKIFSKNNNFHYCYASKNQINSDIDIYAYNYYKNEYPKTKLKYDEFYESIEKIENLIKDFYIEVCEKYEDQGYRTIYYSYDDNEFINLCNEYNYYFYENGKFYGEV